MNEAIKPTRHDLHRLSVWRLATASWRALPDFIIIGAQKAGTTTVYDNLLKHPQVMPADIKEVHFFDTHWQAGVNWYRAHFARRGEMRAGQGAVTGEGSPYYLFHPLVAERVKQVVPQAKLIVVLRNPVDRAYSHYQHEVRRGREPLSFEQAIEAEPQRLAGELKKVLGDASYNSFALQHFSYVERGKYAEQLERWFAVFPREQFLVISSDELNKSFEATMQQVFGFLGLSGQQIDRPKRSNVGSYEKMSGETRVRLTELFKPQNARLEELLGRKFGW